MATYLLTWNPEKGYPWPDFAADVRRVQDTGSLETRWSSGVRKHIDPGDRLFLLRQGNDRPGLVGRGRAITPPFLDLHWDPARYQQGKKALYVGADFDSLYEESIISRAELLRPPFATVHWDTQASGISIRDAVATALEKEWERRVGPSFERGPDEVSDGVYPEGAALQVTINAYERNRAARAACIDYYGCRCAVCAFDFAEVYDKPGIIHVHHLVPLSRITHEYVLDPIADLRPVCPNCHAVIHSRDPQFDLKDVATMCRSKALDPSKPQRKQSHRGAR